MENPRPSKVSVVEEVRGKLEEADAVLLTEYRGLNVSELGALRNAMRSAGGEYKVYKNTLVRLAAKELGIDIDDVLVGPTALAFVSTKADGSPGDIATVAKAVQDFAKTQPLLVLKGGLLGDKILDVAGAKALASLPTADEVYARLAGAVNGNARGLASVISGIHRSLAYVLQAAIDANVFEGGAAEAAPEPEAAAEAPEPEAVTEAPEAEAEAPEAPEASADDVVAEEASTEDAPAAEAAADESEN
ncbi:MAG: 50S ribosomal protein L10 [Acidimicrobiales bacterium]